MKKPILYINACVRKGSRTRKLAEKLLKKIDKPYEEICLADIPFASVNEEYLNRREHLISIGDVQNPMFSLAAPFWDLSFPATLKQYLEQINVVGITFKYSEEGIPIGLCRANQLYYVTTVGGYYVPEEFGFGYVKALAQNYYGIQDVRQISAVGLDIINADVNAIMNAAEDRLSEIDMD